MNLIKEDKVTKGYIGVTDNEWAEFLKKQNRQEVNFWSKKKSFKVLNKGDYFFFLKKNSKEEKGERKLFGYGIFDRFEVLSYEESWNKYLVGNGTGNKEEFEKKIINMYNLGIEKSIGCAILKNVKFFRNPLYLSEIGIEFSNSIVSGKSITSEEVLKILNKFNEEEKIYFCEKDDFISEIDINPKGIEEGNISIQIKEVKRRNKLARELKLQDFKLKHGKIYCEVCGEDDICVLDVHHEKIHVADMQEKHMTKLSDLRVVCANCHRKIHGYGITLEELKNSKKGCRAY